MERSEKIEKGDVITADFLNEISGVASASASMGAGAAGFQGRTGKGVAGNPILALYVMKTTRDIIPDAYSDAKEDLPNMPNAMFMEWDQGASDWTAASGIAGRLVSLSRTPILKDKLVLAYYDKTRAAYVPVALDSTEYVKVTKVFAGYATAKLVVYAPPEGATAYSKTYWRETDTVMAVEVPGTTLVVGQTYSGKLFYYQAGVPVFSVNCCAASGPYGVGPYGYFNPGDLTSITFFVDRNPRCYGNNIVYDRVWITIISNVISMVISDTDPDNPPADPWWCTESGCIQSATMPGGVLSGPYDTEAECVDGGCASMLWWWCVDGGCVSSITPPEGYTGGPFADETSCLGECP